MKCGFHTLSLSTACLSLTLVDIAIVQSHSCTDRLQSSHHLHVGGVELPVGRAVPSLCYISQKHRVFRAVVISHLIYFFLAYAQLHVLLLWWFYLNHVVHSALFRT